MIQSGQFFLSPTAYACFDEPLDAANGQRGFSRGLTQLREALGRCARLAGYLAPFIPDDLTPGLVTHPNQNALAILCPSGQIAETLLCPKHGNRDSIAKALQPEQGYGTYYVTAFRMKVGDGEAAAPYMLWAQERGAWKIVASQSIPPMQLMRIREEGLTDCAG